MMPFTIGLDILQVKKFFFLIVIQESKLIHMIHLIFPPEKILNLHNVIILVKSNLNKIQNHYY